ncbi:V8-like Glu-specific endopeptidase [Povalibacter uvarum]|uniref:Serine protease n=1 Tax=Povalibacter uvarum TaxID=732238 RepID=A0A841HF70_9GAMM|nr:serine protease [Povalibacter uvarum]MBB6091333.1 V8-like Glu-specific endopeptidase [Povalibacter uvarum]
MNLTSPADIANALKAGKYPPVPSWLLAEGAQFIAAEIAPATSAVTAQQLRNASSVLNEYCHFDLTQIVAQAWVDRHGFDLTIQRRQTQALINTGRLDEAARLAAQGESLAATDRAADGELSEYRGLIGRIGKQRFVNTNDRGALLEAMQKYFDEYKRKPRNYWHGINALACQTLEGGAPLPGMPLPDKLAEQILGTVTQSFAKKPGSWEAATASEASLALGNCDTAELWLYRFLAREDTSPFHIDSYARQLREVWGGDPLSGTSCADRLSGIIARYIARAQSRVTFAPSQIAEIKATLEQDGADLEKNFLGESAFTVDSIRSLMKAFESIGCVMNEKGERLGTGFLINGSWLKPEFGDSPVFITNAHVISKDFATAIRPENARVTFELDTGTDGNRPQYKVEKILFSSPPGKIGIVDPGGNGLDCTIARLEGLPPGVAALEARRNLPGISPSSKVFVAGHPRGAGLQIALHDSLLLDIDDLKQLVHYRTPTDPGSSGSPVFNEDWKVIALHHAGTSATPRLRGSGTYEANEGIALAAIRSKLNP